MNKTNIDQALAALADALKSNEPTSFLENPKEFVKRIPQRSLSGDHINGGKIQNFASTGITDSASSTMLSITDNGIKIHKLAEGFETQGTIGASTIKSDMIDSEVIHCGTLRADNIEATINFSNDDPIIFKSDNLDGKGLLWAGKGHTKQLIFASNPDRLFLSENLDLGKGKALSINNLKVLDETSLGTTITKSYLREVGRLNGLVVEGSASIGEYFYFDGRSNRFGLGTDQPNATISLIENDVEIIIGARENAKGFIGTFASHSLDIVTDNVSRINVSQDGNITLGNFKSSPIQVSINGKLSVKVNNPDPDVDLHVNGPIKFGGRLQTHGTGTPDGGSYNKGDIIWNIEPRLGSYVGWVCTQPGSPGLWEPFGKIGNQ